MDALANCTKNKIEPKRRQTWKISAQFHEFGLDSWFWFFSIMGFLNWRKIRCLIKRLHFLALLICDYISCWLRSCTIFVSFLISFLFLSLSCSLVSHFFTVTGQFTDDDAPPLPWSVESDEQIIVAKTEGSPRLLLLLCCFVLSPFASATLVLSQLQVVGSLPFPL